jgi:hypothetical protein
MNDKFVGTFDNIQPQKTMTFPCWINLGKSMHSTKEEAQIIALRQLCVALGMQDKSVQAKNNTPVIA